MPSNSASTIAAGQAITQQERAVIQLEPWRERAAWLAAAEHLNARGLTPCVPCELVGWLRRHGVPAWCQERAA